MPVLFSSLAIKHDCMVATLITIWWFSFLVSRTEREASTIRTKQDSRLGTTQFLFPRLVQRHLETRAHGLDLELVTSRLSFLLEVHE